ncbi:hypothetical protein H5410_041577 [Solanum commersonii]|uniref:Retrotransposon Copia-like N-terminal domain-containing protein n=1 Tax=Solanum commersonii TaxID=4109 RepID=A0A9J5XTZ8_SOLCO|nr:hypothetical protein H5410_041577 [Solanum commersonii]
MEENNVNSSTLEASVVSTNAFALTTSVDSTNAMGNYFPTPNLAHQLHVKLTSINFLFWKTQFLPMICGCGLSQYIDGSKPLPPHLRARGKAIADKLAALQHLVAHDDLVEFFLAGLGPAYRPFTRSLESRHEDVSFDALYDMLLNEERQ